MTQSQRNATNARWRWANQPNLPANLNLGEILSFLALVALAAFAFSQPVQQWVGSATGLNFNAVWAAGFLQGVLITVGLLIVIDDRVSGWIVSRFHMGWVAILAGLYLAFGESLLPLLSHLTWWQAFALIVGVVLIVVGAAYYAMRARGNNP